MGDEEVFEKYMNAIGAFTEVLPACMIILDPVSLKKVEVDNLGFCDKTLCVFEGKRGELDMVQLKKRFFLFQVNRSFAITIGGILEYDVVRVFYYNLKKQRLVEVDRTGKIIKTFSYKNVLELIKELQNI